MKINSSCTGSSPAPRGRSGTNPYAQLGLVVSALAFIAWMTHAGLDVATATKTALSVLLAVVIVTSVNVSAARAALLRALSGGKDAS